ncbi:MAG: cell division protein FtsQ/DivIB [Ahrensia sp.]
MRKGSLRIDAEEAVLPRLLRRPVRYFLRLMDNKVALPRHIETIGMTAIVGGAVVYGSILGGQFQLAVEKVTVTAGLAVEKIEIDGHVHARPEDVFAVLGLDGPRSLFSIDPVESRAALATLPWVKSAQIRKSYPDTLHISIEEREPFAIWQTRDALSVVQVNGDVIGGYSGNSLRHLPLLVGDGAPEEAAAFMQTVAKYEEIAADVRAFVRVGQRRWNLRLQNGLTIKLPESGVEEALQRVVDLQRDHDVLGRDLASIDVRLQDRTVLALTEHAMSQRNAALKARDITNKRVEDSI